MNPTAVTELAAALAFVNGFSSFMLSTSLGRVAYVRYRPLVYIAVGLLIGALVPEWTALTLSQTQPGWGGFLFRASLIATGIAFVMVFFLVYHFVMLERYRFDKPEATTSFGQRIRGKTYPTSEDIRVGPPPLFQRFMAGGTGEVNTPDPHGDFGVGCVDAVLNLMVGKGNRVFFPMVVLSNEQARPWYIGIRFALAGIVRGETIIIFALNRPGYAVVEHLIRESRAERQRAGGLSIEPSGPDDDRNEVRVFVVDCHSRWTGRGGKASGKRLLDCEGRPVSLRFADPRDPIDVSKQYDSILRELRNRAIRGPAPKPPHVRVVYDSVSDLLTFSDPSFVGQYLKHNIVWEDRNCVSALYLLAQGVPAKAAGTVVDQRFLEWNCNWELRFLPGKTGKTVMSVLGLGPRSRAWEVEIVSGTHDYTLGKEVAVPDETQPTEKLTTASEQNFSMVGASVKVSMRNISDELIELDQAQIRAFANSIRRFEFSFDTFDEPLMYPAWDADYSTTANYLFFMVAIDHRTHSPGREYAATVKATNLRGAELLWALGKLELERNPQRFSAESMSSISSDDVARIFSPSNGSEVQVAGPSERAALLRDCGEGLLRLYQGQAFNMVRAADGYLETANASGLLDRLRTFNAYSDPQRKKAFLLVKFLERRRLLSIRDPGNLHVPVDNVLQRVALRSGIVKVRRPELESRIRAGSPISSAEDEELRAGVAMAFDEVARETGLTPTFLDDVLWEFGRVHCRVPVPVCDLTPHDSALRVHRLVKVGPKGGCPFGPGCQGYGKPARWALREPEFATTYY